MAGILRQWLALTVPLVQLRGGKEYSPYVVKDYDALKYLEGAIGLAEQGRSSHGEEPARPYPPDAVFHDGQLSVRKYFPLGPRPSASH